PPISTLFPYTTLFRSRRPPDPAFGARLGAGRRQAGLTQRELAERAGVTLNSIWRYETGRRPEDYDVLARLGEAVGVSVDFLLRGDRKSTRLNSSHLGI